MGATLAFVLIATALPLVAPAFAASRSGAAASAKPALAPTSLVSYQLPFAAGATFEVVQGWNTNFSHNGRSAFAYDFKLPAGTPVLAAAAGTVAFVHTGERACGGASLRDYANYITIYHADGTATQYGHLARVDVAVGDVVDAGQQIGLSGRTGDDDDHARWGCGVCNQHDGPADDRGGARSRGASTRRRPLGDVSRRLAP